MTSKYDTAAVWPGEIRQSFAYRLTLPLPECGHSTQSSVETGQAKAWAAYEALSVCRKKLGVSSGAMHSLEAIISFIDDQGSPVVNAANRTICGRMLLGEPTLRRHLNELVRHGLIRRAGSSSGKRHKLRDPDGPDLISGIDLTPRLARHEAFLIMAQEVWDNEARLRILRHRSYDALARHLKAGAMVDDEETAALRRYLRRTRSCEELADVVSKLEAGLTKTPIVRQKQPECP